jgi:hypothetical protein
MWARDGHLSPTPNGATILLALLLLVVLLLSLTATAALVALLGDVISYQRHPSRGLPTWRRLRQDVTRVLRGIRR